MKTILIVTVAVMLLLCTVDAFPYGYKQVRQYRPKFRPVPIAYPVYPYPGYQPGFGFGAEQGLGLLGSAALIGSGNPFGQAFGLMGLSSFL